MIRRCPLAVLAFLCLTVFEGVAHAHKPSDSYLTLNTAGDSITGQWDIALRDLDFALGLDSDQDRAITWGEVKARQAEIAAYAFARLRLGPADAPCQPDVHEHLIDTHSDGAYAVMRFTATCRAPRQSLDIAYRLFFDIDPTHRGLVNLSAGSENRAAIFSAETPVQSFALAGLSWRAQFADYFKEGVWHIWSGFDHILFLLALLLPVLLIGSAKPGDSWITAPAFKGALKSVFKVVTAFTLAHAVTLAVAVIGTITVPTRLVESAVAATVVLAALNNVRPVVKAGGWMLGFGFGLIHGFGFASVLGGLGLPGMTLAVALLAFNIGVEAGQLAIVALFLPLANALFHTPFLRRMLLVGGSLAVAALAAMWFVQRAFNLELFSRFG